MYNTGGIQSVVQYAKISGVSAVVKNLLSNRVKRKNQNFLQLVMDF